MLFNFNWYDLKAFAQNEFQASQLEKIYQNAIREAARLAASLGSIDKFSFDRFPQIKKQIDKLFQLMAQQTEFVINKGTTDSWALANAKNDAFLEYLAQQTGHDKTYLQHKYNYGVRNQEALKAFQNRKTDGLNLSQRVWNYTQQAKNEIDIAIDAALIEGNSAQKLATQVKEYLKYPDKLFRRIRDNNGGLVPSKAMKAFHPGQGVYRSSHKNAMRLARTEINMAYREADHLRWSQLDFVKGIEIKLSNNPNHCPTCEQLKGIYPKTFKFVGWHPQCRCFAVPYLVDKKAFIDGLLNDTPQPTDYITELPDNFNEWIKDNNERIKRAKQLPYFVRDNKEILKGNFKLISNTRINLSEYLKGDVIKNSDVKKLFLEVGKLMPDWFRNGIEEFNFSSAKSFMMQHSMSYSSRTMDWVGGSKFKVSNKTFSNKFNPASDLKGALKGLRDGNPLTFNQEYAIESIWHEILHARTKTKPLMLSNLQRENMETINQFVARHTYSDLIELFGGKAIHKSDILDKGYGYKSWITNFRDKLSKSGISESDALEFLQPHLLNDYGNLGEKIKELFSRNSKVKTK